MEEYLDKLNFFPEPDWNALAAEVEENTAVTREGFGSYVEPIVTLPDESGGLAYIGGDKASHPYYCHIQDAGVTSVDVIFEQAYVTEPESGTTHTVKIGGQSFKDAGIQSLNDGDKWYRHIETEINGTIKTSKEGEEGEDPVEVHIEFVRFSAGEAEPETTEFAERLGSSDGSDGSYWMKILEVRKEANEEAEIIYFHSENERWEYRHMDHVNGSGSKLLRRYNLSKDPPCYEAALITGKAATANNDVGINVYVPDADVLEVRAEPSGASGSMIWQMTCDGESPESYELVVKDGMIESIDGPVPLGQCNEAAYEHPVYTDTTVNFFHKCGSGGATEVVGTLNFNAGHMTTGGTIDIEVGEGCGGGGGGIPEGYYEKPIMICEGGNAVPYTILVKSVT